ncbi:family 16 glycoside hydrolase [Parabacteroides sp. AM08-6]|uniref:family 16 glycoside hydrolase n=1 Tax=Parabacteroides sp. AM08-6 TaxID=2292053 RepID=UPI000EFF3A5C|nr:family 16 glycoside hydrolase [Parabacteroides sp. AM08-6]RHJ81876.1 DUF1080 domain-containing protein [Parabacteroides sp. AM08-6]
MKINKWKLLALLGGSLWAGMPEGLYAQEGSITIDASKIENRIPSFLYGACIEDVNHEIYGGLYDQKVFGESFEEPDGGFVFENHTPYEGLWKKQKDRLLVNAHPGAKLVYEGTIMKDGSVETELRFSGKAGDNAGLLVRVGNPGKGADNFDGYEISLAADGSKVVFGKHLHNWQPLKEVPVKCSPGTWNKLKVSMKDKQIEVFLNNKRLFVYEDKETPIVEGKVSLRTWNSDVEFRNLCIEKDGKKQPVEWNGTEKLSISRHWDAIQTADSKVKFVHDNQEAYNGDYSQSIQMLTEEGTAGIANSSLNHWGIAISTDETFQGRLYLKGADFKGPVTVALQNADGTREYAKQTIPSITGEWTKYPFTLTANDTDPKARLAIYINQPGRIWIDQVVLMSTGDKQFHGLPFRNDIGTAMQRQGLTFLRYGGTMVNAPEYRFKKMIGDPDKRPPYRGHWNPYSTNGFGIEEFLQFCEVAGFKAAFAVNIEETPEDISDMVEYLNGPVTSEWGRKRAENGHPAPYAVEYIEIGNEEVIQADDAAGYRHYIERFNLLYDAIHRKDASVKVINSAWWRPDSPNMETVFKALNGKAAYWDYHPWADDTNSGLLVEKELKKMQALFQQWNPDTQMKCAIFEENGNLHNMQRALGHVTLQNAVRRCGNFVLTSCAANALQPYLQNDNGWDQGQVFFTPTQVWGMPPYYAQQMASENHLPLLISSHSSDNLDVTATKSEDGKTLVLHVANIHRQTVPAKIEIKGCKVSGQAEAITLSGNLDDRNTPGQPRKIIPVKHPLQGAANMTYSFPPHSYTILKLTN